MRSTYYVDATRIAPGLYQGSAPPPGPAVRGCGFDTVVFCAQEIQPPVTHYPGVSVIHAGIDDAVLSPDEWRVVREAAKHVTLRVRSGEKVLVTCAQGRNRSGIVVALALHLLSGRRGASIVKHIQKHRLGALMNPSFVAKLSTLQGRVGGEPR